MKANARKIIACPCVARPQPQLRRRGYRTCAELVPPSRMKKEDLLLEPLDEPLEQLDPYLVLTDGIFNSMFEVRIIVDLHHNDAVVGLLEVDAIKSVANRFGGADGEIDDLRRRLIQI